ncbi:MAG: Jag N-terminal domain-containing protein, partial [Thermodesulfobacteriota bacterium]
MSAAKKDFFGKEVADAIKEACTSLQAAQENLDIEVIETGSTGIFGLIRKKAHIRASVKGDGEESAEVAEPKKKAAPKKKAGRPKKAAKKEQPKQESVPETEADAEVKSEKKAVKKAAPVVEKEPLTEETIEAVREQLSELLTRMGFPSEVKTEVEGVNLHCHIGGDHQEALTGQEGKILDSLQYLMRKMITRSVNQRVRLSIDVGDFRERREQDLKEQAVVLAAKV